MMLGVHFFWFSKDALHGLNMAEKTLIMLQKISISNKCCSFVLSIHQIIQIQNKNRYHFFLQKSVD